MSHDAPCVPGAVNELAADWETWGGFEAYPEEATVRGFSMPAASQPFEFESGFDSIDCFNGDLMQNFDTCHATKVQPFIRFEELGAPYLPSDPIFRLERSTLYVSAPVSAASLGNCVLDFLNGTISSVVKVSVAKFSVKADVFVDGVMCTVKVRVYYRRAYSDHVVQFQRRCGSAQSFATFYRDASVVLRERFGTAVKGLEGAASCLAPMPPVSLPFPELPMLLPMEGLPAGDFDALLHLALAEGEPELQAEAAVALASADEAMLAQLCKVEGFKRALESLLRADRLEVLYPVSILLSRLSSKPEVLKGLADCQGPLKERCGAAGASELLQKELNAGLRAASKA